MNSEINETIGQSSYKELVEAIGKALSEGRDKAIQTVNATLKIGRASCRERV